MTKISYLCIIKIQIEMILPREGKQSSTCTRKICHVWAQKSLQNSCIQKPNKNINKHRYPTTKRGPQTSSQTSLRA